MLLPATSFWGDRLKASGIHLALSLPLAALAARPDFWQPCAPAIPDVLKAAKPVAFFKSRFASRAADIDRALASMARAPQAVVYLPMAGRKDFWTVFLDPAAAAVLRFMPLDSF